MEGELGEGVAVELRELDLLDPSAATADGVGVRIRTGDRPGDQERSRRGWNTTLSSASATVLRARGGHCAADRPLLYRMGAERLSSKPVPPWRTPERR
jgi:hypothetical protein